MVDCVIILVLFYFIPLLINLCLVGYDSKLEKYYDRSGQFVSGFFFPSNGIGIMASFTPFVNFIGYAAIISQFSHVKIGFYHILDKVRYKIFKI